MNNFKMGNADHLKYYEYTGHNANRKQAFTLIHMGDFCCDSEYFTKRDNYNQCLLIYTLEGQGSMEYNQRQYDLLPGTLMIINCNHYQHYKTVGDRWRFLWIHFDGVTSFDLVDSINENELYTVQIAPNDFKQYFEYIKDLIHQNYKNTGLEISLTLHQILALVMAQKVMNTKKEYRRFKSNINKSVSYMKNNFEKKITIEQIAGVSNISKYYFIKIFQELTGTTPYQYLLTVRINESKKLLKYTDDSIAVIADKTGFCDSKNFIVHFKKMTGTTPLQFRINSIM